MNRHFSGRTSPLLAAVIKETTIKGAAAAIRQAEIRGATGIDLHLSMLPRREITVSNLRTILQAAHVPVMALHYNWDCLGNSLNLSDEERIAHLRTAAEAGVDCVDIQGYTFSPEDTRLSVTEARITEETFFAAKQPKEVSLNPEVIAKQTELIHMFHQMGTEVLLSVHCDISMNCDEIVAMVRFLSKRGPDVIKIVGLCDTDKELAEFCKTVLVLKETFPQKSISYHCNGSKGPLTRVIGPMLGSYLMFCNETYTAASDGNQLHLGSMSVVWDLLKKQGVIV